MARKYTNPACFRVLIHRTLVLFLVTIGAASAQITVLENGGGNGQLEGLNQGGAVIEQPTLAPENQAQPTVLVLEVNFEARTQHNPLPGRVKHREIKWNGCSGRICTGSITSGYDYMNACEAVAGVVGALRSFQVDSTRVDINRCNRSAKLPSLPASQEGAGGMAQTPSSNTVLQPLDQRSQKIQTLKSNKGSMLSQNGGSMVLQPTGKKSSKKSDELGTMRQAQTAALENGRRCRKNSSCKSGYCANGRKCAPRDRTGKAGDYCHHDNHCAAGGCICAKGLAGFCKNWERWPEGQYDASHSSKKRIGRCGAQRKKGFTCSADYECSGSLLCSPITKTCQPVNKQTNLDDGFKCTQNTQCKSGYCANGKRCAPKDGTGKSMDYCHHDNHCASGSCNCSKGFGGFCREWEKWPEGKNFGAGVGSCDAKQDHGGPCRKDSECKSGSFCANGKKCAPRDGRGKSNGYCHHDNHCRTGQCICPRGAKSFGFCSNWESYTKQETDRENKARTGFYCK